jgi:hypothetical protein
LHLSFDVAGRQSNSPHQNSLGPGGIAEPRACPPEENHGAIRVWISLHGLFQEPRGLGHPSGLNPLISEVNPRGLSRFKPLDLGEVRVR